MKVFENNEFQINNKQSLENEDKCKNEIKILLKVVSDGDS